MIESNQQRGSGEATIYSLTLADILYIVRSNWYWFLISAVVCLCIALIYLGYKAPLYQRTATVLVKDSKKGSSSDLTAFSDLVGNMGHRSVDNELHIFKSRHIMEQVAMRYDLTSRYTTKQGLRNVDLYGRTPIMVEIIGGTPTESVTFRYTTHGDKIYLTHFAQGGQSYDYEATANIGDTIATPIGEITTIATPHYHKGKEISVEVLKMSLNESVEEYRKRLTCEIADKQSSIITLKMIDPVPLRAENIVNGIIEAYNVDAIEDKQSISNLTERFISERLATLGNELNIADGDIATFKQQNLIYSPEIEASLSAEEIKQLKESRLSLQGNLEMAEYILNLLRDPNNKHSLIPASTISMSGASTPLATQVEQYNTTLLTHQRLCSAASDRNPTIIELANRINNLHTAILSSLQSHIEGLKLQISQLAKQQSVADRRIYSSPTKEKELLSKARQQKVKEELYIYLLTKLEENALMGATAESNARIIDSAYGSDKQITPSPMAVIAVALILGLLIPMALLYLREILDTKVRSRHDIEEALSMPFIGDIPQHKGHKGDSIVVQDDSRSAISEAFRMMRTNIGFMSIDGRIKVIMTTSSIPHSGKTFVSTNLAATLAASGQRVLVIDIDLRRRTLSKSQGHGNDRRGLTSYLTGGIATLDEIIIASDIDPNLDFIFSGPQPPNPAEMLLSQRMDELIAELRPRYDYIILDSVPAMAVADAMIIDRLVDLTIYVIRQGNLDRRHLPDIEQLYRDKKFHNMCVVLNGVTATKRSYGYGYGYGYGYLNDTEKPSLKERIIKLIKGKG